MFRPLAILGTGFLLLSRPIPVYPTTFHFFLTGSQATKNAPPGGPVPPLKKNQTDPDRAMPGLARAVYCNPSIVLTDTGAECALYFVTDCTELQKKVRVTKTKYALKSCRLESQLRTKLKVVNLSHSCALVTTLKVVNLSHNCALNFKLWRCAKWYRKVKSGVVGVLATEKTSKAWEKSVLGVVRCVPSSFLQSLHDGLPKRVKQLLDAKGGPIAKQNLQIVYNGKRYYLFLVTVGNVQYGSAFFILLSLVFLQ